MKKTAVICLFLASCAKMNTKPVNQSTEDVNNSIRAKYGVVTFWTKTPNRNLIVSINNDTRVTSTWDNQEPSCNQDNHINERLRVGTYQYTATLVKYSQNGSEESKKVSGSVTVSDGDCLKVEISE